MARVTVEDCLAQVPNRFALTILASRRARMIGEGRGRPMVDCDNKEGVTALREIGEGMVRFKQDVNGVLLEFIQEQRQQLRVTAGEHTFLEAASLRAMDEEDDDDGEEGVDGDVAELPVDLADVSVRVPKRADGDDDDVVEAEPETAADDLADDGDEGEAFAADIEDAELPEALEGDDVDDDGDAGAGADAEAGADDDLA